MEFVYTLHAKEKLQRTDIKKFEVTKETLEKAITDPDYPEKETSTGEVAVLGELREGYNIRVVYVKIDGKIKIITFHIAKSGRYETLKDTL